jgi:aryl-alcohol dehydrogenase-like predicted oxidoreductase
LANCGVGKWCWWQKYWHVAEPVEETLGALNDLVKAGKVL